MLIWGIVIVALLVGGGLVMRARTGKQEPIIKTEAVTRGDIIASVSGNGTLQPWTTIEVKSNVGGQVVELAVDEGDDVKTGQLIARIDPSDSEINLQQAEADLTGAESRIGQAKQGKALASLQSTASIRSAQGGAESARQRLLQAEQQAKVQPMLTRASIEQAESALDAARATLEQTRKALVSQKIAAAQASYDQAKAGFVQAQSNLTRQRALLAKGFVAASQVESAEQQYATTNAQLDNAQNKLDTVKMETAEDIRAAEARVKQAEASLETARANRVQDDVKQQDVAVARAALRQAEANLSSAKAGAYQTTMKQEDLVQARAQAQRSHAAVKNAQTQLGYTTILSPGNGVVVKKYVEPGSIVTAGRSSLGGSGAGVTIVDIADVTRMQVIVNVDETDIAQIRVGQRVKIEVDAYPDERFMGRVTKIAPNAIVDQNVTSVPVTVELRQADRRLKTGMNATCDFVVNEKRNVLLVPTQALKETDAGMTVSILKRGKKQEQVTRKVTVGIEGNDNTEITSGLREGEMVVTSVIMPQAKAKDGLGAQNNQGKSGQPGASRSMRGATRGARGGGPGGGPPGHF